MTSEQLTPKMSPIALCLDDPKNSSAFQSLLASPTKLNLDSTGGFYSTSLSKLNDYARSGRSRDRRGSDTFRSLSPIRFNLSTSNNNNNNISGPKMLKAEYLTQKKTNLPLLSTLLKSANSSSDQNRKPSNKNANFDNSTLIKETLEQIQQQQRNLKKSTETKKKTIKKENEKIDACTSTANNNGKIREDNMCDIPPPEKIVELSLRSNSIVSGGSTLGNDFTPEIDVRKRQDNTKDIFSENGRVMSASSTVFHTGSPQIDTLNEFQTLNVENFPTDTNGFIDMSTHQKFARNPHNMNSNGGNITSPTFNNKPGNRFSFISSTSTDYELLFDQNGHPIAQGNINGQPNASYAAVSLHSTQSPNLYTESSVSNSNSNARSAQEIETSKLDLKIKYLEVEIQELRLQNEKLINSMNSNRATEDTLLMELLKQKTSISDEKSIADSNFDMESISARKNKSMEKKVKLLEKKFDDYKKVLEKLNYIDQNISIEDSMNQDVSQFKRKTNSRRSKRSTLRLPKVSRISRISSVDLRRIEENSDYSSLVVNGKEHSSSSEEEIINDYEDVCFENSDEDHTDAAEYQADDENESRSQKDTIKLIKRNSKRGLQLHLPIQK
ncbi:hypothetical protein C6P45_004231 [Maudiozyma exigua]|uniref:Uncharacterized protein n=1 Tax=Maudiozyma exigua TaxID=34358 RepID=A0A9P7BBR5_MAUEX|nr:hypothetical protein C6P45_004231 [Kazachstania exigua]